MKMVCFNGSKCFASRLWPQNDVSSVLEWISCVLLFCYHFMYDLETITSHPVVGGNIYVMRCGVWMGIKGKCVRFIQRRFWHTWPILNDTSSEATKNRNRYFFGMGHQNRNSVSKAESIGVSETAFAFNDLAAGWMRTQT